MVERNKVQSPQGDRPCDAPPHDALPGGRIPYRPELIALLVREHQALLGLHAEIQGRLKRANYENIPPLLVRLRVALEEHIESENRLLYRYLEQGLAGNALNLDLLRGFRRDMDRIEQATRRFLAKYEAAGVQARHQEAFGAELAAMGQSLSERMGREEQILFPLYMPRYA